MGRENVALFAFNRGLVSKYGLARVDVKRLALSASVFTNYMPRVLGSMMLRPGLGYLGATASNAQAVQIAFVFSTSDTALLELTNDLMRVRVDDVLVTRASVSTTISNGTFSSLTNWTDADETGAVSDNTGSKLNLTGTGYNAAIRRQQLTIAGGDQNVQHALRIVIERGPVTFRAGSSSGADDYIAETSLKTGTHSLTFTPAGASVYLQFSSVTKTIKYVTSIAVESSGTLTLPTPWATANLASLRWDQSGDVIFVACDGIQQRRIERRAHNSWSVALYSPDDGPFRPINTTPTTISASALTGDVTLTASKPLFKSTQVGALFELTSNGQNVIADLAGNDQYTDPVRISGVGSNDRAQIITITGVWVGRLSHQRSFDNGVTWHTGYEWTANAATDTFVDGLDNQIILYRIGFKSGNYTSGTAHVVITNPGGGITGVARITAFSSSTSVSAAVTKPLGGTNGTNLWKEGSWSDYRGWPTAVSLYEGRLWWAGRAYIWGSESDAYEDFDEDVLGDAGPISRSLGRGPVDRIRWLLPVLRLVMGSEGSEISARSTSLDEPLTPTNFNLKASSTQGSANVAAVGVDDQGFFVEKSGRNVFKLALDQTGVSYGADNQSEYIPEILIGGVVQLCVQRQPETRVHCRLTDGTVAVLLFDANENVACWLKVVTDGEVEDIAVLPGDIEDQVYYTIRRTVNSSTVRYLEKWAREDQAVPGTLCRCADAFVTYSGAPATVLGSLSHLEGKAVIVWGDGKDFSPDVDGVQTTYTVSGGSITIPEAVSDAVIGLPYTAQWQSSKLAYAANLGTALTQTKTLSQVGLILADAHAHALKVGQDFDHLDDLPLVRSGGAAVTADETFDEADVEPFPINGEWTTDARLCMETKAPRPVTILAAIIAIETNSK